MQLKHAEIYQLQNQNIALVCPVLRMSIDELTVSDVAKTFIGAMTQKCSDIAVQLWTSAAPQCVCVTQCKLKSMIVMVRSGIGFFS